jgi:phosphate transport system substrate-binding protein
MTTRRLCAALAAVTIFCAATAAYALAGTTTITLSGSTSMQPLVQKLAQAFAKKSGVRFTIFGGGSDVGITDASRGRVTLGMSSRDPKPADPGGIVFNKIARDSVCVVTNEDNPIATLSQSQIQDIFSGRIRSWAQVPGARVSGPISLIVRTPASGTQDAFQNIFMGEDLRVAGSATTKASNGLQAQAIAADPLAIGYASFSFTQGLHAVPYQGVVCTLRTAKSGEYEGVRNFFLVSRGKANGFAKKFIKFARSNSKAQRIIASNWVPLK